MDTIENSSTLYHIALTLIHFLWQGGLIALALKFCLVFSSQKQAQLRYVLSCMALTLCLLAPIFTFVSIYQPDISSTAIFQSSLSSTDTTSIANDRSVYSWQDDVVSALPYVSMLWLISVALLTSKLLLELHQVNRLTRVGTMPPLDDLQHRFNGLVKKIGLSQKPKLLITLKTEVPMAIGWLKPVVLIPASMVTGLTPSQLDMLLLHELAHVRRHDYLVNVIQTLVETLLFFHPSVRWISKQIRNEREYCSDDIAVAHAGDPVAYAHTLADTASLCRSHRHHSIPNMAMAASGGDLKQRVIRLVDQHHCSSSDDSGKFLASLLIIVSVFAVAIKPYVNFPFIDLTSGHISFFDSNSEYRLPQFDNKVAVSDTSIASLLLNQDKITPLVEHNTSPVTFVEESPILEQPIVNLVRAVSDNEQTNDFSESTLQDETAELTLTAIENNPTTPLAVKQESELNSFVSEKSTQAIALPEPITQSQSDIAFAQTDSTNIESGMTNPYANDIATLMDEPIVETDYNLAAEKHVPLEVSAVLPIENKTITLVEQQKLPVKSSAKMIISPEPRYPSTAKRKGLELDVKVDFTIDEQGRVRNIQFEKKSKVSYFRSSIRTAMAKWRFLPAQVEGKPVESQMSKIFSFNLMK